jgi:predicted DNA-binding protein YlxM (UPF0122 family)
MDINNKQSKETTPLKVYLKDKRDELVWAISQQDYSLADVGMIFNISKAAVFRIVKRMPDGWTSPWRKDKQV